MRAFEGQAGPGNGDTAEAFWERRNQEDVP